MTDVIDLEAVLDEMHAAVLGLLPPDLADLSDIGKARATIAALFEALPLPPMPETVTVSEVRVPGLGSDPDVRWSEDEQDFIARSLNGS